MALITTITSTDVAASAPQAAVLPVGSFEQHGDHLPLATDTIIAATIADRLAAAYNLFPLPPITISCSHEHEGLPGRPGTVSISAVTVSTVITDIRTSLHRSGIETLILVNGHGGNYALSNIAQEANIDRPTVGLYPRTPDWITARANSGITSDHTADMHGGELETSILLHEHPDLVRPSFRGADFAAPDRPNLLVTGIAGYTTTGIIGSPSAATAAKGKAVLDSLVDSAELYLTQFQSLPTID